MNNFSKEDGSIMDRFSHNVLHYIKRNTNFSETINELSNNVVDDYSNSIDVMMKNKGYDF